MKPTQVRAASILLNKVLPDLKAIEVDFHAQLKTISVQSLSDEELLAIIAQGRSEHSVIEGEVANEPRKLIGSKP